MPPLELASLQLSPSLPSPSVLVHGLKMVHPCSSQLHIFKIWMNRQMFLIQKVYACAHLGVNQLLDLRGISTAPLLVCCSPLDCFYHKTHDFEFLWHIKDMKQVDCMASDHLVIT